MLPKDDNVKIEMFDLLGNKVDEPFHGFMNAGDHKYFWDSRDIPSGVYICRITTSDTTASSKITLLK